MKKIMFLQIKGKSFGGIWLVNKTLANEFMKENYEVEVCSIRDNHPGNYEKTKFKQYTINKVEDWPWTRKKAVLKSITKGPKNFLTTTKKYIHEQVSLKKDYKTMQKYIKKENPDYIIASHYQTLPGIPKEYLKKTVHIQHSSFNTMLKDQKNVKTLKKYNKKLFALIWLCNSTFKLAENYGFIKNKYIYNPARISCIENPDIANSKRFIVLSRFAPEKRIDLMVKMVNDVFQNSKYQDWTFYLFGQGKLSEETQKIIENSNQIFNKGTAADIKKELLLSSCSLNTSLFEGFPMSLIESFTCGVPAVIFNYGESANEIIQDNYNGFVVKQDDINAFKEKLIEVMDNSNLLLQMSKNAKKYAQKFKIESIILEWIKLFNEIDK